MMSDSDMESKSPEHVPPPGHKAGESDQYRALFEQSADAILIIDGDTFVDCNQATVDMLRYRDREELLRTHPSELSPLTQPDGRSSFEKANEMIAMAFREGSHRFEWDHKRADGEVFPVEVLLTVLPQGDRTILHTVWRDITDRKRLEHQLLHSQKMDAIGQLAGGIAHDFNNLLVAIIGNADLLADAVSDKPELRDLAEQVRLAGERAASLTRQLLAFSRKQLLQPKVFDLNAILVDLEKFLGRLIGENIALVTRLHDGAVKVKADPGQLEQVVINLVTNARDAQDDGGAITIQTSVVVIDELTDHTKLGLEPGRYAKLVVADGGRGMSEEMAKQAFDPFFTTKEVGQGTGLGLSTVYGIVKQSQGDVILESVPDRGTTITIYLPEIGADESAVAQQSTETAASLGGHETILVAEDEPAVSGLVARVLRQHGYRVLLASDGVEAFARYKRHCEEIDLVFTDIIMPNLCGPDLIRLLHNEGFDPNVLFASGYMDSEFDQVKAMDEEANLILKPFSPDDLLRRIRKALDR